MRRLIDAGLALGYAGLIFFLSSLSTVPVPEGVWNVDKAIHVVEYAALSLLIARALRPSSTESSTALGMNADCSRSNQRITVSAAVLAALYGLSDELHQSFVPGRASDPFDVLADAIGAVLGVMIFTFHSRHASRVGRGT